jgi:antitoxin component of MazEF toxin-antitoxin module
MQISIRRVGNSLGVIIPIETLRAWGLGEGDSLELNREGIYPRRRRRRAVHAALDALKRAISLEVAARFAPGEIRERSLANLERWKHSGVWCSAYDEWQEILSSGDDGRLYTTMLAEDDRTNRLRQSMPFVGMLPQDVLERLREEAAR